MGKGSRRWHSCLTTTGDRARSPVRTSDLQQRPGGKGGGNGNMVATKTTHWSDDVFREMKARDIRTVCTIPDGGLTQLLQKIEADPALRLVTLSTQRRARLRLA